MGQTEIVGRTNGGVSNNILLALIADQANMNADVVVEFVDNIVGITENNGITFNNTTHRVLLKSNETYKLQAYIRHDGTTIATRQNYAWYDVTNATFLGKENTISSEGFATAQGSQIVATVIITPSAEIEVELRCKSVSVVNQGIFSDSTYATIETIISGTSISPPIGQGEIIITDGGIIATIINPANWNTDGNYTGSVIGLIAVNIYYDDAENLKYLFDGTMLRRFTYNSVI